MGRIPKQTFLQGKHTDGQEAHEKMFNIINYQRNANQNYKEIALHTGQNSHHQKFYKQWDLPAGQEKTLIQKDRCTPMFTAALFTIAGTWKQLTCPSTEEWIKKMWYIYTMKFTQP